MQPSIINIGVIEDVTRLPLPMARMCYEYLFENSNVQSFHSLHSITIQNDGDNKSS
jgi:hypothetical protein